jgi:hypothetical protein
MSFVKYLYEYEELVDLEFCEVSNILEMTEGVKVKELTFADKNLTFNGVYIFKQENEITYVGKAKSRTFLERFAGHFDYRKEGGFNNIIKTLVAKNTKDIEEQQKFLNAYKIALQYKVVLIKVTDSKYIEPLELLLQNGFTPDLNTRMSKARKNNKNKIYGTLRENVFKMFEETRDRRSKRKVKLKVNLLKG